MQRKSETGFEDWEGYQYAETYAQTILEQESEPDMRRFEGYHPSFLDPSYRHVSSMNGHQQSFIEEEKYSLASSPATSHAIALEKRQNSHWLGCWSSAGYLQHSSSETQFALETRSAHAVPTLNHSDGKGFSYLESMYSGSETTEPLTSELEEVVSVSDQLCQDPPKNKVYKTITLQEKKQIYSYVSVSDHQYLKRGLKQTLKFFTAHNRRTVKRICEEGPDRKIGSGRRVTEKTYQDKLFQMMAALIKRYRCKVSESVLKLADLLLMKEEQDRSGGWRQCKIKRFKNAGIIPQKNIKIDEELLASHPKARDLEKKLLK